MRGVVFLFELLGLQGVGFLVEGFGLWGVGFLVEVLVFADIYPEKYEPVVEVLLYSDTILYYKLNL